MKMKSEVEECEANIGRALQHNPLVRLLVQALTDSGCDVIPHRHLVCEPCSPSAGVYGGFDQEMNQIMICSNSCTSPEKVEEILVHELVHMFDYCAAKINFDDVDHLACTEIRAANLAHCHLGDRLLGNFPFLTHQSCVKRRASNSVRVIKGFSSADSMKIVEKNFQKCYHDLEPIGRRFTNSREDGCKALQEYVAFKKLLNVRNIKRKKD